MNVIIPTGGSNLGSIVSAIERLGMQVEVSEDFDRIRHAEHVILPGVGHAKPMMQRFKERELDVFIPTLTQPVLGICLGMQLLFEYSEEGDVAGLGIIPGRVREIPKLGLPLPHMGWNEIQAIKEHRLAQAVDGEHGYFVHSYFVEDGPWTLAVTDYRTRIPALIRWKNFYGAQFHPERSGRVGEALLKEFLCI